MKIVIIGGSGLIGTKLVNTLRDHGHEALAASPTSGVNALTGVGLSAALAEERAHVEALASALAAYGTSVRQGIEQADARGDRDTAHFHRDLTGCRHVSLARGGPPRVVRPEGDQRMPVRASQEQPTTTGKAGS